MYTFLVSLPFEAKRNVFEDLTFHLLFFKVFILYSSSSAILHQEPMLYLEEKLVKMANEDGVRNFFLSDFG